MRTRAGIVLQARMDSSRLPGKAMLPIGDAPVVTHCLRRLVAAGVARVVLATTDRPQDDVLADTATALGVSVYRGDVDDVLARMRAAAETFDLDPVVRATGDNPAVDIQAPGRVLEALRAMRADYVVEQGLPYGAAVEVVTREALRAAARDATDREDREHVTTWVKRQTDRFRIVYPEAPAPLRRPDLRLTVDLPEDLLYVRTLFARSGADEPSLSRLIQVAGRARKEVA
jgi:spore coat polysaccharide biosynthesis protein SpsF (cytidylyltransferase family)